MPKKSRGAPASQSRWAETSRDRRVLKRAPASRKPVGGRPLVACAPLERGPPRSGWHPSGRRLLNPRANLLRMLIVVLVMTTGRSNAAVAVVLGRSWRVRLRKGATPANLLR